MKNVFRYTSLVSISVSLIIFSLGSFPQTFAGPDTIPSTLTMEITCGLSITGSADFGLVSAGDTIFNTDVNLSNGGTATAVITANVGTSLVSSSLAGGYAGVTDLTTHISPSDITLQIDSQGRVPMMRSGMDVEIGGLSSTDPGVLEVGVNINPINLPTNDSVWVATYELTVFDCRLE